MPKKYTDAYIAAVARGQEQASSPYVRRLANAYKAGKLVPGGSRASARGHTSTRGKQDYEPPHSPKPPKPRRPPLEDEVLKQYLLQYFKRPASVNRSIRSQLERKRTNLQTIQECLGVDRIANSAIIFPGAIYQFEDRIIARGHDNEGYYLTEIISLRSGRTIYQWMLPDDITGVLNNSITSVSDRTISDVVIYFAAL
jgi:hypothetical protein